MNPVMPAKLHRIDHFCSHTKCMRSIPCKYHHLDLDNTHTQRERERERERTAPTWKQTVHKCW